MHSPHTTARIRSSVRMSTFESIMRAEGRWRYARQSEVLARRMKFIAMRRALISLWRTAIYRVRHEDDAKLDGMKTCRRPCRFSKISAFRRLSASLIIVAHFGGMTRMANVARSL